MLFQVCYVVEFTLSRKKNDVGNDIEYDRVLVVIICFGNGRDAGAF